MTYTIGSYLATHLSQIGLKHHFAVAGDYFGRSRTAVPGERQQRGRRAWLKRMATANKSRRRPVCPRRLASASARAWVAGTARSQA
jgi:hypothetical protein